MAKKLFVICGLDTKLSHNVEKALEQKFAQFALFLSFPASLKKDRYSPTQVDTIAKNICNFIHTKKNDLPYSMTIIYAPDESQDCLISGCFLFSNLVCCRYRTLFNLDSIIEDLVQIIDGYNFSHPEKYKYLPTENFIVSGSLRVQELFLEYFRGNLLETDIQKYFVAKNFNCENFPNFLSGKTKKKFYVDNRSLIFPPCKIGEEHGDVHESDIENRGAFYYLTALYRFGILKGAGFHYDVQYAKNRLGRAKFKCTKDGEVTASDQTHANIYLNDTVRFP